MLFRSVQDWVNKTEAEFNAFAEMIEAELQSGADAFNKTFEKELAAKPQKWPFPMPDTTFDNLIAAEEVPCFSCGETYTEADLVEMSGQYICPSCGEGWVMPEDRPQESDSLVEDKGKYDYKGQFDVDAECVQCDWKGTVDDLYYEDEFADGVCPECKQPVEFITKD